ncbi:hypothetical protein TNCV_4434311 [Trichonephila clavipes]|nr:hypothetical protein TNCV_4434311 [Trichonephila clavipes]
MSDCWSVGVFNAARKERMRTDESETDVCTYIRSLLIPTPSRNINSNNATINSRIQAHNVTMVWDVSIANPVRSREVLITNMYSPLQLAVGKIHLYAWYRSDLIFSSIVAVSGISVIIRFQ